MIDFLFFYKIYQVSSLHSLEIMVYVLIFKNFTQVIFVRNNFL
jgi:hypothetical protein